MTNRFSTYLLLFLALIGSSLVMRAQDVLLHCAEPSGCAPHGVIVEALLANGNSAENTHWTVYTPAGATLQSTANPYVAIFNQPGSYSFSVTVDGQPHLFENFVTLFAKPQAQITAVDSQGCLPFCTVLNDASVAGSGAIISRSWDFGDGTISQEANPTHCYEQTGVYTPVLAVEDVNGCFSSVSAPQLISVTTNYPTASFAVGAQNSCFFPTTLELAAETTSDVVEQHWFLDGNMLPGQESVQPITFNDIGAYAVCLAVENLIGCVDTSCQTINISDEPEARFTFSRDTICAGQTIAFNNHSLPLATSTEWDYNGNGTIDGTQTNGSFTYTSSGTFIISMTSHYGSACSVTVQDTLHVEGNPTIDFTGTNLYTCSPPLVSSFNNNEPFNPDFDYVWSVDGVVVANTHNLTYTFTEFGAHDVRLRRYTSAGCERSRNKIGFVQIDSHDISFAYDDWLCVGENAVVSNITIEGNETILDYSWDFNGDGQEDALGPNPIFIFDTPGEFFATLTATTTEGCVSSYTTPTPIHVLEPVVPSFNSLLVESCAGETFGFCTDYNADNVYSWDFHDGGSPQQMLAIDSCITHIYEDTGYFDVTLSVFNGACNSAITVADYIHVVPPLALFDYEISCSDFTAAFHDHSIEGDSLVWDFGDGSPFAVNESNPVHTYAEPGEYTVVLSAYKTGSICFDTKTQQVAVALPSTGIVLTPSIGCAPLSVGVEAPGNNDYWQLSFENGDRITVERNDNPFSAPWTIEYEHDGQNDVTTSTNPNSFTWPTLTFEESGLFDVHVVVIDAFGCEAETTYTDALEVWPGGNYSDINAQLINACDSGGVTVSVEAIHPLATSWLWSFNDGTSSTTQQVDHRFEAPFNYDSGISCALLATDANGCTSSSNVVFDVVLPASPLFTWSAPPVCRHEEILFVNASQAPQGTQYEWSFGDGQLATQPTQISHAYNLNGSYAACLTATNPIGCVSTWCNPMAIDVYSPTASVEFHTQLNTCLFAVTLENSSEDQSVTTWWDFGDNQTGIGDTVLHTYPIGVYDVRFIVGANNGCADTLIIEDILNYSSSVGPFTQVLDSANCAPFGVSFQVFNPADQLFDYFWDFNDGNGDPFGGTQTSHSYTEPGTYCPSIMMTDPNGCDVYIHCTDTIVVENYAATALIPEHICAGEEATIVVLHADAIEWSHPWVQSGSNATELIVRADSSFQFVITAHYSDCVQYQTIEIHALPLPEVQLALIDSVCSDTGSLLLMGGIPESESAYYTINNTSTTTLNTANYSGQYAEVTYHYTGENGCANTAADSLFVIALPVVGQLANRSFCENDSTLILGFNPLEYYTIDGVINDVFEPHYTGAERLVTRHVYDDFGCYASSSATYMVNDAPDGSVSAHDLCALDAVDIQATATVEQGAVADVTWTIDGEETGVGYHALREGYDVGGDHLIAFTFRSEAGCMSTTDTTFSVFDLPTSQFETTVACEKDTTFLTDLSVFGNDSIVSWLWQYSGSSLNSFGDTSIVFPNAGATLLVLEVTTQHGCTHSSQRAITVRYAPQIAAHVESHCIGQPTLFGSTMSIPSGGIVASHWDIEGAPYIMEGQNAAYQFNNAGNYSFTLTAESNFGCESSLEDSVWVYALPEIVLPAGAYEFCANQEVAVSAQASVSGPSAVSEITWLLDGVVVSQQNPAHFEVVDLGAYVLDVIVISDRGCEAKSTLEQPIVVYPNPIAGFTWSLNQLTENPSVDVISTASGDVVTAGYDWGDGGSGFEQTHTYATDGVYAINQIVTNSFGCSAYHSETIEAYNGLQFYIPTAFTPDQNNHNETFLPVVSGSHITLYVFRVFNRWGIEVFTSTIPGEGWDGTYHDEYVQDGAYNWSVDMIVQGQKSLFAKKGSVLLMR